MDGSVLTSSQRQNLQTPARRVSAGGSHKDLWSVTRQGSFAEVDSALALLKKIGGNVDLRNMFGLTPLHIATWRNHIPVVRRLLAASADPDARDGESGWSSIHRALHFGHLAVANILLQSGASLTLEDSKSRTPVDLLSGSVSQVVGSYHNSVSMEVFSWGSGTNYQLGTGNAPYRSCHAKLTHFKDHTLSWFLIRSFTVLQLVHLEKSTLGDLEEGGVLDTQTLIFTRSY